MFQPMYSTDALTVKSLGEINTPRGNVFASTSVLVQDSNYIITLPISLSSHQKIDIMINCSPTSKQDFISSTYSSTRDKAKYSNEPIANPNFEQNWIQIGTIPGDAVGIVGSLSSVITNIPTRFLRLEGQSFTAVNFYAFIWTQKMASGY